jgi:transposase-like protein
MTEFVSLKEASRRFGYEASTIRRWLKEQRVDGLKGPTENSPWKVSVGSLEQLLREGASAGRSGTPRAGTGGGALPDLLRSWSDAIDARISSREPRALSDRQRAEARQALIELEGWLSDLGNELDPG